MNYEAKRLKAIELIEAAKKMSKRKIGDPQDLLPFEFARIVLEIHPATISMENVPEFIRKKLPDGRKVADCFTQIISHSDWDLYYSILAEYGGSDERS